MKIKSLSFSMLLLTLPCFSVNAMNKIAATYDDSIVKKIKNNICYDKKISKYSLAGTNMSFGILEIINLFQTKNLLHILPAAFATTFAIHKLTKQDVTPDNISKEETLAYAKKQLRKRKSVFSCCHSKSKIKIPTNDLESFVEKYKTNNI